MPLFVYGTRYKNFMYLVLLSYEKSRKELAASAMEQKMSNDKGK